VLARRHVLPNAARTRPILTHTCTLPVFGNFNLTAHRPAMLPYPAPAGGKMEKRKTNIIDKKFQLRTTFSIIGVVYLVVSIIIAAIAINAALNNRQLSELMQRHRGIISTQYETLSDVLALSRTRTWDKLESASEKMSRDLDRNMTQIDENIATMRRIYTSNYVLMIAVFVIVIVQGALLYILLIRKTHRISGPILIMTRQIEDIIEGRCPDVRPIRENDEFRHFYERFGTMIEVLRDRYPRKKPD